MANTGYARAVYVDNKQEPKFAFSCNLCEKRRKRTEATKYCTECFVYMCDPCVRNKHNQFPLNTRHRMVEKDQFVSMSQPILKSFPTTRCKTHPGELINMYCADHDVVCCSVCKAMDHSDCADTQHLPKAAEGVLSSKEYLGLKDEVRTLLSDVEKQIGHLEEEKSGIAKDKQKVKQIIADFRKRLNLHLDDLEQKTLVEVNKKTKLMVKEIDEQKLQMERLKKESQSVLEHLNAFKGENECELFVQVKFGNAIINVAAEKLYNIPKDNPASLIEFEIDPNIENFFKSLTMLGSFSEMSQPTALLSDASKKWHISPTPHSSNASGDMYEPPTLKLNDTFKNSRVPQERRSIQLSANATSTRLPSVSSAKTIASSSPRRSILSSSPRQTVLTSSPRQTVLSSSPRQTISRMNSGSFVKYKTQLLGAFVVKEKSDPKVCSVSDICQLTDGNYVITDFRNRKMKRLQMKSYKVLDSIQLPGQPTAVCVAGPDQVAVSLCEEKKIQLVSVGNKSMELRRAFGLGNYCRGIVCINDNFFVCSGGKVNSNLGCIRVYDSDGQLRQSIPRAPQRLSSVPRSIAVCDDGQHFLVTSLDSYSVTMINFAGHVVNTFNDIDLKDPLGISTDGNGQVFICGNYSNTVIQLSPRHNKIEVLLREEDRIRNPQAVYFDKERQRLVVSCCDSNELLVFKIPQEKKRTSKK